MALLLQDSSGIVWLVSAPSGLLTTTSQGFGMAPVSYLNDPTESVSWQLGVTTGGLLTTTSVPLDSSFPTSIQVSLNYQVQVTLGGLLQTSLFFVPPSPPVVPEVRQPILSPLGQVIPLTTAPQQNFSSTLQVDGSPITLNFEVKWNSMAGYWTMAISDANNNLLVDSMPFITGWYPAANMLAQSNYLKIGAAYILNNGNVTSDYPGVSDLGSAFSLLWADTAI